MDFQRVFAKKSETWTERRLRIHPHKSTINKSTGTILSMSVLQRGESRSNFLGNGIVQQIKTSQDSIVDRRGRGSRPNKFRLRFILCDEFISIDRFKFTKIIDMQCWARRSLTPFVNRKDEYERQKKMSRKFVNQAAKVWIKPLSLSIWAAEKISIEFISQAAIRSLVIKNSSGLWIARLEFQVAKNELIDRKNESLTVSATIYPISTRNPCQMCRNRTSETFQNERRK